MTHPFGPPSVRQIRVALEEVDGALRYEPLPEESPEGIDPATELVVWTPGPVASDQHASLTEADQESDLGNRVGDEPAVIFEVPPSLTDLDIHQTLGQDGIEKINRLAEVRGLDALGWYVTFHQSRFQHGIHIPVEGLLWMTVRVFDNLPLPVDRKIELAFHTVLRHELFHFSTDCMIANWELASGHQVYWASRRSKNADGYLPFEEGVANAYMLRGFKYPSRRLAKAPGVLAALSDFCRRQPFGYDLGPDYAKTKAEFLRRCADNAHDYHRVSAAPWHAPDAFDAIVMYPDVIRIDWTRCPIILQNSSISGGDWVWISRSSEHWSGSKRLRVFDAPTTSLTSHCGACGRNENFNSRSQLRYAAWISSNGSRAEKILTRCDLTAIIAHISAATVCKTFGMR